ncbi:MAG: polysaccharide deacetylase family protein [Bacteroidales bacterium]|jgi:hypothetical protein|nr:polysaccharide deacetylase family protein [Bacteroidales bacterium]MDI9575733.1 polysaccharide deacetylase family protein [Bacteroidota bacterium]MDY0400879.1 polysaccharide deacetylase family protein [Bacteroidales bacterium]HHW59957.1 hypothetical protein [Bacteroidales bacterium]HOB77277.1 polysaccharide deacetylase family protein [Bacteroidales bacterium]
MTPVIIASDFISERLKYTLDFIFKTVLEFPYILINDLDAFAHIRYSTKPSTESINIFKISPLLNDNFLTKEIPTTEKSDNHLSLYPINQENYFNQDIFSAVFYCISGYERYFNKYFDIHGRFIPENSTIFHRGFPFIYPWVDKWIFLLAKELKTRFKDLPIQFEKIYKLQVTIDVDIAYTYLCKGFYRNIGGLFRDLLNLKFLDVFNRIATLMQIKKDDYDHFDLLLEIGKYLQNPLIFFFLLSNKTTKFDKNNHINCRRFLNLIRTISNKYHVGIHYSYYAKDNPDLIKLEKTTLEKIINEKIKIGRAHYLRLDMPDMNNLANIGIKEDYSIGYASLPGFPLGTSHPLYYYDLKGEKITNLLLHQTSLMEGTFVDYKKSTVDDFKNTFEQLKSSLVLGGEIVLLFHNESFTNKNRWQGWTPFFIEFLKNIK